MSGVITLQTYSRPNLLSKCLRSIERLNNSSKVQKIIVLQTGNSKVENIVRRFSNPMTRVLEVSGVERTALQNINFNRFLAMETAFSDPHVDWVLSLEEDVQLAPGALEFINQIYGLFKTFDEFRGINLGSIETNPNYIDSFSLLRYGLHGNASMVTRRTWSRMKFWQLRKKLSWFAFDGCVEGVMKSGFVVTPNITFVLDLGWFSGTHTTPTPDSPYYLANQQSWSVRCQSEVQVFRPYSVKHSWREDCVTYEEKDDFRYFLKEIYNFMYHTLVFQNLLKHFRILKHIFLNSNKG